MSGDAILDAYCKYREGTKTLSEVLDQLSISLKEGKMEHACSNNISIADFCMVAFR
jgi:hypothetical protein